MKKKELKDCIDRLNEIKTKHKESLLSLNEELMAIEESKGDGDELDQSTNLSETLRLKNLKSQLEVKTMQIKAAEQRLESGKFGICLTCEDDIPMKRLIANPFSIRCLSCQEDQEMVDNNNKLMQKLAGKQVEAEED